MKTLFKIFSYLPPEFCLRKHIFFIFFSKILISGVFCHFVSKSSSMNKYANVNKRLTVKLNY